METYGAFEAKTHLSSLLDRVAKGERITITKHGIPMAVMQPPSPQPKKDRHVVIETLKKFRAQHSLGPNSLKELIEEGRD
jgi:prevent-host-death family protein